MNFNHIHKGVLLLFALVLTTGLSLNAQNRDSLKKMQPTNILKPVSHQGPVVKSGRAKVPARIPAGAQESIRLTQKGLLISEKKSLNLTVSSIKPGLITFDRGMKLGYKMPRDYVIKLKEKEVVKLNFVQQSIAGAMHKSVRMADQRGKPIFNRISKGGHKPISVNQPTWTVKQGKDGNAIIDLPSEKVYAVKAMFQTTGGRAISLTKGKPQMVTIGRDRYEIILINSLHTIPGKSGDSVDGPPYFLEYALRKL